MKIGLISDVKYCLPVAPFTAEDAKKRADRLSAALRAFVKEKVDICFCIGNLVEQKHQNRTQVLECFSEVLEVIHATNLPFYYATAPEDFLKTTAEDLRTLLGLYETQYTVHADDMLFLLIDGSYTSQTHHFNQNDTLPAEFLLPDHLVESLRKRLAILNHWMVISYHNLDSEIASSLTLKNADDLRAILRNASQSDRPFSLTVAQAAHHHTEDFTLDGIRCIAVPPLHTSDTDFYRIVEC